MSLCLSGLRIGQTLRIVSRMLYGGWSYNDTIVFVIVIFLSFYLDITFAVIFYLCSLNFFFQ